MHRSRTAGVTVRSTAIASGAPSTIERRRRTVRVPRSRADFRAVVLTVVARTIFESDRLVAHLDARAHPHASEAVPHGLAGGVVARWRRHDVGWRRRRVGGRRVIVGGRRRRGPHRGVYLRTGPATTENPRRDLAIFGARLDRRAYHCHDQPDCPDGSHDVPRIVDWP